MTFAIHGLAVARGIAIGRAVLVASSRVDVPHVFIDPARIEDEVARLLNARNEVSTEFDILKRDLPPDAPQELEIGRAHV